MAKVTVVVPTCWRGDSETAPGPEDAICDHPMPVDAPSTPKGDALPPSLPKRLERLRELAHNLWWCWHRGAIDLFRRLDRDLWEGTNHNPVLTLVRSQTTRYQRAGS